MKRYLFGILIAGIGLMLQFGCQNIADSNEIDPEKKVTLSGQVFDIENNLPMENAVVQVFNISPEIILYTDAQGQYFTEFELDVAMTLKIVARKETFTSDSVEILAVPGEALNVPRLDLGATLLTPVKSGKAATIVFVAQSAPTIGVKESGAPETAKLYFEVQDSSGIAVDLDHAIEIDFRVGSSPGGGEFIHPSRAKTNGKGIVETFIFSGTKAGVVQLLAEAVLNGKTIRSLPVALTIHGGLPDRAHFSAAPEKGNFPGYNILGLNNSITAFVGDKYGNPVRPQTAVYYTTTGGIIGGSAQTDAQGRASVSLMSAAPQPNHPTLGPGFATITASTADENKNTIETSIVVLFSGIPRLLASPTSFAIPNGGSQQFSYTVSDQNGNPLSEGTQISVKVDGVGVKALGKVNFTLPDTQSRGWTQFGFTVVDDDTTAKVAPVVIDISTSGPNGRGGLSIGGTAE